MSEILQKKIITPLILILLFLSCKKETNNGLIGKWKLTETFNGYANGGDFRWNGVSMENAHTLDFSANGQYLRQESQNGGNLQCSGTFLLQGNDQLDINSNCSTASEKLKIVEIGSTMLILEKPVREGYIRYKYAAAR